MRAAEHILDLERFSVGRLLRLIASRCYHIEIALKPVGRPTATKHKPAAVVQRYDQMDWAGAPHFCF